jgi:hypothetical protein
MSKVVGSSVVVWFRAEQSAASRLDTELEILLAEYQKAN